MSIIAARDAEMAGQAGGRDVQKHGRKTDAQHLPVAIDSGHDRPEAV